MKAQLLQLPNW